MIYTIYKLCCDDTDKFYVGSTRNRKERVRKHRNDSKVKDSKVYQTIREFGGWDNWRMVDLERYECDNKRQAEKREEELRVQLKAELNTRKSYRTKEEEAQYQKDYYLANKTHLDEYKKKHFETHKEEHNRDAKKHRETHREEIKARARELVMCECGLTLTKSCMSRHRKSKRHTEWMASQS